MEQMSSTFIEQGVVMDKHISSFEVPPASFQPVDIISALVLVPVYYERILVPAFIRFTGISNGITHLQRKGVQGAYRIHVPNVLCTMSP
jgi:peptide/histidine transporter 3/4